MALVAVSDGVDGEAVAWSGTHARPWSAARHGGGRAVLGAVWAARQWDGTAWCDDRQAVACGACVRMPLLLLSSRRASHHDLLLLLLVALRMAGCCCVGLVYACRRRSSVYMAKDLRAMFRVLLLYVILVCACNTRWVGAQARRW